MQITKNAIMLFYTRYKYQLENDLRKERKAIKSVEGKYTETVEIKDLQAAIRLHDYYQKNKPRYPYKR